MPVQNYFIYRVNKDVIRSMPDRASESE